MNERDESIRLKARIEMRCCELAVFRDANAGTCQNI